MVVAVGRPTEGEAAELGLRVKIGTGRPEKRLVEAAAGDGANRKSEQRDVLSQELGSTSVERGEGSNNTKPSTHPVDSEARRELADQEEEKGHIEEEEDEDQGEVDPQGRQEENEGDDEPGSDKYSGAAPEFPKIICEGSFKTEAGVKEGSVDHPENAVNFESTRAEQVSGIKLPYPGNDLSKTTGKTGHTDDRMRSSDTGGLDVVHGDDESGASEK